MSRHLDPKAVEHLSEQAAYSEGELQAYNDYWDTVSTEKTLWKGKFEEGKVEGKAEGKAEGRAEAMEHVARALLAQGISIEQISQVTGLPITSIKSF